MCELARRRRRRATVAHPARRRRRAACPGTAPAARLPGYATHEREAERDTTGLKPFGVPLNFVNTASKEILGIDYIPLEDSVIDMGKALIATGYIPPAAEAQ